MSLIATKCLLFHIGQMRFATNTFVVSPAEAPWRLLFDWFSSGIVFFIFFSLFIKHPIEWQGQKCVIDSWGRLVAPCSASARPFCGEHPAPHTLWNTFTSGKKRLEWANSSTPFASGRLQRSSYGALQDVTGPWVISAECWRLLSLLNNLAAPWLQCCRSWLFITSIQWQLYSFHWGLSCILYWIPHWLFDSTCDQKSSSGLFF